MLITILLDHESQLIPMKFEHDGVPPVPTVGESVFVEYLDERNELTTSKFKVLNRSFLYRADNGAQECVVKLEVKPIANWRAYN